MARKRYQNTTPSPAPRVLSTLETSSAPEFVDHGEEAPIGVGPIGEHDHLGDYELRDHEDRGQCSGNGDRGGEPALPRDLGLACHVALAAGSSRLTRGGQYSTSSRPTIRDSRSPTSSRSSAGAAKRMPPDAPARPELLMRERRHYSPRWWK